MRIDYILKANAQRAINSLITVDVDGSFGTVTIDSPGQETISMQGDDAEQFIADCDKYYNRCKSLDLGTIHLALAYPYAENLWN